MREAVRASCVRANARALLCTLQGGRAFGVKSADAPGIKAPEEKELRGGPDPLKRGGGRAGDSENAQMRSHGHGHRKMRGSASGFLGGVFT